MAFEVQPRTHRATVAATWSTGAPFTVTEAEFASPTGDHILVDIEAVGICHADVAAARGSFPVPLPAVLGHEGTGTVRAVGPDVRTLRVGHRVVLTFDSCHRCVPCTAGRFTQCDRYMALNFGIGPTDSGPTIAAAGGELFAGFFGQSSFGSLAVASERNAVAIDSAVESQLLAPLGCAVQTGAGAVLSVGRPKPGSTVAIVGMGSVGFAALTAAVQFSPAGVVVAMDRYAARLELAQELGADVALDASGGDAFDELASIGGADLVVECSGAPTGLPGSLRAVKTGGTVVVVGAPAFGTTAPVDVADLINRSITVRGTVEGDSQPHRMIPWLAHMVAKGRWPLARIVTSYPLSGIETAVADMVAGRVIKPVLIP